MGQKSTKEKELERASHRRKHPKPSQIAFGDMNQLVNRVKNRNQKDNSQPAPVVLHKVEVPGKKIALFAVVIVGVAHYCWNLMVGIVHQAHFTKGKHGIDKQHKAADRVI